jgi:hypothetical protein
VRNAPVECLAPVSSAINPHSRQTSFRSQERQAMGPAASQSIGSRRRGVLMAVFV